MQQTAAPLRPAPRIPELEPLLAVIETRLGELAQALCAGDALMVESAADALHRALAQAASQFARAASQGSVPSPLRRRFAAAGAQVAVQRESLARATAALDRAMDALMPGMGTKPSNVYSASGLTGHDSSGACVSA
jgi:hypothetical protein